MGLTISQSRELLTVETDELTLAFSRDDGGLRVLRRAAGPNLAGYGGPRPSVDVCVGERGWLSERMLVRFLRHTAEERDGAAHVTIISGIGPLMVYDRYRITGTWIARRVTVVNVGEDPLQLRGVRMVLPWLRVGSLESGRFDAPGNSVRPRVPLTVAAEQRAGVLPRRYFAPGLRADQAFEPSPTAAAGLMALHEESGGEALLCWYHSVGETALPQVDGNGEAVSVAHQVDLAGWLGADAELTAETQHILLLHEPWSLAMGAFRRTHSLAGGAWAVAPSPAWLPDAALYEVHPAQHGGLAGLTAALPHLAAMGITALCLLPIWEYGAGAGRLWDGNRDLPGPAAVHNFERLDPAIGGPDDLRQLVEAAHAHGMRVIVDLPLAGCAPSSPHIAAHPEWFCRDEQGRLARVDGPEQIVPFDWAQQPLREFLAGVALALLRDFQLDGFRVSPPRVPRPNWSRDVPYHASAGTLGYLAFIEQLRAAARAERPEAAVIGALGGPACAERQDASIDELAHHMFFHLGLTRLTPAELAQWLADHIGALPEGAVRICYTESSLTHLLNPLADGLRGSRISRLLLAGLMLCGFVPMIHCGQEQGEEPFLTDLLAARAGSAALRRGAVSYDAVTCSSQQVFTVLRQFEDDAVIGLLNVGPHRHTVTLGVPVEALGLAEGEFHVVDILSGERWCEEGRHTWGRDALRQLRLTLEPFGAYALTLRPSASPPSRTAAAGQQAALAT